MLSSGVKEMEDFYEVLDRCAFDVDKAVAETKVETRTLPEIINEMLKEAGLDAMAPIQSKSVSEQHD